MRKKNLLIALALALVVAVIGFGIKHSASASFTVECVPSDAVPAVWANFQPNDQQATFVGPPSYPNDERGSWNVHDQIPGGHADEPEGVYAKGNPDKGGNWFFKQASKDAVTCDEDPDPTCETDPTLCPIDEPEIKFDSICISQTEIKVSKYELVDGEWVLVDVQFHPAWTPNMPGRRPVWMMLDCSIKVSNPPESDPKSTPKGSVGSPRTLTRDDVEAQIAAETYAYEEGM